MRISRDVDTASQREKGPSTIKQAHTTQITLLNPQFVCRMFFPARPPPPDSLHLKEKPSSSPISSEELPSPTLHHQPHIFLLSLAPHHRQLLRAQYACFSESEGRAQGLCISQTCSISPFLVKVLNITEPCSLCSKRGNNYSTYSHPENSAYNTCLTQSKRCYLWI